MRERHREVRGAEIQAAEVQTAEDQVAEDQVAEDRAAEVQTAGQGQWASAVGIDQGQGGIHGLEGGTIRAEHHTAGNRDREGMEEVVQIAVRREGRNLAGIGAAGGNREELGRLPGAAGEGPGEEDSVEQVLNQALG